MKNLVKIKEIHGVLSSTSRDFSSFRTKSERLTKKEHPIYSNWCSRMF